MYENSYENGKNVKVNCFENWKGYYKNRKTSLVLHVESFNYRELH